MLVFTTKEKLIADRIKALKQASGSHSPNKATMLREIPELKIKVDACFLSNPYANDLFLKHFKKDIRSPKILKEIIESYPSQNRAIAKTLGAHLGVPSQNIFIANGAIEIIQAVMHRFVRGKLLVTLPTFSPYYEFATPGTEVVYNYLKKENNFLWDTEKFIKTVRKSGAKSAVIINPNNPDGGYIPKSGIRRICDELSDLDNIIIDESFIHFADETEAGEIPSAVELIATHPNIIVVKSMSKDFGIAGVRAGYGVMNETKVKELLKNGFLWNSSGIAEYFFNLYTKKDFSEAYEKVRKNYIRVTKNFIEALGRVPGIKTYPSRANFALIEFTDGTKAKDAVLKLLISYGIHTRDCGDKIGLSGEFIRVASRTEKENKLIISAFRNILGNL